MPIVIFQIGKDNLRIEPESKKLLRPVDVKTVWPVDVETETNHLTILLDYSRQ